MKKLIILTMILGLAACGSDDEPTVGSVPTDTIPDSSEPEDSAPDDSPSEVPRYWMNDDLPLDVKISEDFDNSSDFTFSNGAIQGFGWVQMSWEGAVPGKTFFGVSELVMNQAYTNIDDFNDGEIGVYKSYTWYPEFPSEAVAVTRYLAYRRNVGSSNEFLEMAHADIFLNYRDYTFSFGGLPSHYDILSVLTHELGHLLGLGDVGQSSADVMFGSLQADESRRTLSGLDETSIRDLYTNHAYSPEDSEGEGELVVGILALTAAGDCNHYEDGELMHTHKANKK